MKRPIDVYADVPSLRAAVAEALSRSAQQAVARDGVFVLLVGRGEAPAQVLASLGAERPGCSEGIEAPMAQTRRDSVPPTGVVDEPH